MKTKNTAEGLRQLAEFVEKESGKIIPTFDDLLKRVEALERIEKLRILGQVDG